jgi:hypothetical protein
MVKNVARTLILLGGVTLMAVGACIMLTTLGMIANPFFYGPDASIQIGTVNVYFYPITLLFDFLIGGLIVAGLLITIGAARME